MNYWGTIPDWINVVIALFAFVGFIIVERERLIFKLRNDPQNKVENSFTPTNAENRKPDFLEDTVDFRAGLYSRILVGIILGLALGPIYSWAFSGLLQTNEGSDYALNSTRLIATVVSAFAFSTLLSFVHLRTSPRWASGFVHWVERLALSFFGFALILNNADIGVQLHNDGVNNLIYHLDYDSFSNLIICVIMFIIVGFPSTPIDWIINFAAMLRKTIIGL